MKTFLTLTILLFNFCTFAQTDNSGIINKIRKTVEQINKDSAYTIKVLYEDEFLDHTTDEGAQLTGYFKNGQLVKIVEWIGLSSCIDIEEYYLQNNKLIFTYTRGNEYPYNDSLGGFDRNKLSLTMECRFYFDHDKVVKKIFKGFSRCGGQPTIDWAKEDLDDYSRYTTLGHKIRK